MNNKVKLLDNIFSALANEKRRQIMHSLSLQPSSINQLANVHNLSLPAIHRHIKILEEAQLVQRKKSGRINFLALDRTALLLLSDWIAEYNPHWGSNQETLENYIAALEKKE